MYYATADEMAKLDELAVVSGLEIRQMMELAGWHMLQLFKTSGVSKDSNVAIVVGKGNKGGDGLSAARHLANHGYVVTVYLLDRKISPDAQHHLDLLEKMEVVVQDYTGQTFKDYDVIIDSLIGYRLSGAPRGNYAEAINQMNSSSAKVISYDLPTGVDATTGEVEGEPVNADYTLMLALPKKALHSRANSDKFGEVYLADIGIPEYLYNQVEESSRPDFIDSSLLLIN